MSFQQVPFPGFSNCSSRTVPPRRRRQLNVRPAFVFSVNENLSVERQLKPAIPAVPQLCRFPFHADLAPLVAVAGRPLTSLEVDFLHLAFAAYAVDRLAPRFPYGRNGRCFWRRSITLSLPVADCNHFT